MTKIVSRQNNSAAGDGEFTLQVSREELELIASTLYITRLNGGKYGYAARSLLDTIDEAVGLTDWAMQAYDNVSPIFEVELPGYQPYLVSGADCVILV